MQVLMAVTLEPRARRTHRKPNSMGTVIIALESLRLLVLRRRVIIPLLLLRLLGLRENLLVDRGGIFELPHLSFPLSLCYWRCIAMAFWLFSLYLYQKEMERWRFCVSLRIPDVLRKKEQFCWFILVLGSLNV